MPSRGIYFGLRKSASTAFCDNTLSEPDKALSAPISLTRSESVNPVSAPNIVVRAPDNAPSAPNIAVSTPDNALSTHDIALNVPYIFLSTHNNDWSTSDNALSALDKPLCAPDNTLSDPDKPLSAGPFLTLFSLNLVNNAPNSALSDPEPQK